MSNKTEWQKWCAETALVMAAAGRGEVVQVRDDKGWVDKRQGSAFGYPAKYRIKPRTIRIGEYDVPEPMREAPEVGASFWSFNLAGEVGEFFWERSYSNGIAFTNGMIHSTKEAAELHYKALISLTAKKD